MPVSCLILLFGGRWAHFILLCFVANWFWPYAKCVCICNFGCHHQCIFPICRLCNSIVCFAEGAGGRHSSNTIQNQSKFAFQRVSSEMPVAEGKHVLQKMFHAHFMQEQIKITTIFWKTWCWNNWIVSGWE